MSEPTTNTASVSFSFDDAVAIAQALGSAATAFNPAVAGTVAAVTGIAELLRNTVLPAIRSVRDKQMDIATQAQLAADSALERARVGAPPAVIN